jgi:hypothetical protein
VVRPAGAAAEEPGADDGQAEDAEPRGEAVISSADHARLLAAATPQFRMVLTVLHATGAGRARRAGSPRENFDPAAGVVKLAEHKSDRTGRLRLLFLTRRSSPS